MKKQNWEEEFDEEFEDCKAYGFPIPTKTRLKSFIRRKLTQQREDIMGEIEKEYESYSSRVGTEWLSFGIWLEKNWNKIREKI